MNFYNNTHPYYCGIDLHAKTLYVCIINQEGNTCLHKEIAASPKKLQALLEPYIGNVVVGVECMHCWYWVSDFCEDLGVDLKNISAREQLRSTFPDPVVQRTIDLDMAVLECYAKECNRKINPALSA
ncbi:MAG: hypothetical protein BMS9Abin08_0623 [Gammaproteobacteria bacterium]|nr:MAG: hypothetical protein BMS9Abin08_0623 [Gammaproteobacteria bacterium]